MGQVRRIIDKVEDLNSKVVASTFNFLGSVGIMGGASGIGNMLRYSPDKNNNELFGEGFTNYATTLSWLTIGHVALLKRFAKSANYLVYANLLQATWLVITYVNHKYLHATSNPEQTAAIAFTLGTILTNGVVHKYRQDYLNSQ